jgi:hypothetical protein
MTDNPAETIARATGSVAATVTHERRNPDGTLTTEAVHTYHRDAAEYGIVTMPPTVDSFGNTHQVAVLTYGGVVVGTIRQEEYGHERKHVVTGVNVAEDTDGWGRNYLRMDSTPNSGAETFDHEPTAAEAAQRTQGHVDTEDAYGFVRWAEKGTPVPDGKSEVWHQARKAASQRFGRQVRSGKITGAKRTW